MLFVKVVWFVAKLVLATSKSVTKRDIGRDTHHYAIGPTIKPEDAHNYQYQVAFRENCSQNCGGTIISDRHILTAAHCVSGSDPRPMTIKAGVTYVDDPNGQIRDVFAVKVHRNYKRQFINNDVALLTLQEPLNLTGLTVAKLPNENEDFEGDLIEITGWGHTVHLTYAYYAVSNNTRDECQHYSKLCVNPSPKMKMYSGDSGGPAVVRRGTDVILVGVVSGMTGDLKQHFLANVAHLRPWIDTAMKEGNEIGHMTNNLLPQLLKHNCTK